MLRGGGGGKCDFGEKGRVKNGNERGDRRAEGEQIE